MPLKAPVHHPTVTRTLPRTAEGPTLLYQSGIEFPGLTSETLAALRQLLADLGEARTST